MRGQFLKVIEAIQQRTHEEAVRGPTLSGRKGELQYLVELLSDALTAESVCENECRRLARIAHSRQIEWLAQSLDAHAEVERKIVERLGRRIRELGGLPPICSPEAEQIASHDNDPLADLLDEELEVERIAVKTCCEIAERIADVDPEARQTVEDALDCERSHLTQLTKLTHP